MRPADELLADLRTRGDMMEIAPGLVGVRGSTVTIHHHVNRLMEAASRAVAQDEWLPSAGVSLETLARTGYLASSPYRLTLASHLGDDATLLESIAGAQDPVAALRSTTLEAVIALPPAICCQVYAALAGSRLDAPRTITGQGTCWRHRGSAYEPLSRDWAFTMREIICVGDAETVERFRRLGIRLAERLTRRLCLLSAVKLAPDRSRDPAAHRGAHVPRLRRLKHELHLPLDDHRTLVAASFSNHGHFFGDAFDIRLADDSPAASACIAFGLERWVLAFLAAHGPDPDGWRWLEAAVRRATSILKIADGGRSIRDDPPGAGGSSGFISSGPASAFLRARSLPEAVMC